jgi:hypothetical protein
MTSAGFSVVCPDYTKGFKTATAAIRWLMEVERTGHCDHVHQVVRR